MTGGLPAGWAETTLERAGTWRSGGTPSRRRPDFFGKGIPWVKSGDLPDGPILRTAEELTKEGLANSTSKLLPPGTISMALYGATIGKLGTMTFPAATNQACANVIADGQLIEASYLFYYLLAERQRFIEQGQGGAQPNISQEIVRNHPLRLPPLPEQRRIVAKLEKLLGKVDACKERLAKIPVLLKRFRQAVLAAACSGKLTADWRGEAPPNSLLPLEPPNPGDMINVEEIVDAPGSWRWIPLQAVCDPGRSICYGVIKLGAETPNGIPCLRTSNVKPLAIDTTNVKRIAVAISDEYRRTLLRGGELLVNVRGTLGGVAVVPPDMHGWNVSREVAVVPVQGVLPRFIALWIASVPCQDWLTGAAKGVAYTGINIADLKLLPVVIPSLAEQSEIVRRVDALFAVADQIQTRFERAREQVEKLTPALLGRAFRGELVPQDPNDEPASALLARIRAKRNL